MGSELKPDVHSVSMRRSTRQTVSHIMYQGLTRDNAMVDDAQVGGDNFEFDFKKHRIFGLLFPSSIKSLVICLSIKLEQKLPGLDLPAAAAAAQGDRDHRVIEDSRV